MNDVGFEVLSHFKHNRKLNVISRNHRYKSGLCYCHEIACNSYSNLLFEFMRDIWTWMIGLSYWFVCLTSIVSVCLYAVSRNKKYMQYVGIAFTVWIFMKGFNSIL